MKIDLLSIPIAITTFVASPEPISIYTDYQKEDFINKSSIVKGLHYFDPIKTDPLLDYRNKICSFINLPANWDGRGAVAPNRSTINNSLTFIDILPEPAYVGLNADNIVATPYGTIVFDIEMNDNLVSVEIGESKIGFFTDFADGSNLPPLDSAIFNQNTLPLEFLTALNKLSLQEVEA